MCGEGGELVCRLGRGGCVVEEGGVEPVLEEEDGAEIGAMVESVAEERGCCQGFGSGEAVMGWLVCLGGG